MTTRIVEFGGCRREELLEQLVEAGVELNEMGQRLLACEAFETPPVRRQLVVVEMTVRELGLPQGGTIAQVFERAAAAGLLACPVALGPYLRLQYREQPEGFVGQPVYQHRAPPGSLTIASEAIREDDEFPKGFYLRRINDTLWLRGYRADAENVWQPEDRLAFCRP